MAHTSASPASDMSPYEATLRGLKRLSKETRELDIGGGVDVVHMRDLTTARFLRNYVSSNKPCLIRGALTHWQACGKWSEEYFRSLEELHVTVEVTPTGFGDAVVPLESAASEDSKVELCFATPHQQQMTMGGFLDFMHSSRVDDASRTIPYLSHQNSNLTEEVGVLLEDVEASMPWADDALGGPPDAVNIWIGDDRSTTSFHKDHYENMYAVVRGTKIFTLLPPCDTFRMHLHSYPVAQYTPDQQGRLAPRLSQPLQEVVWCPIDPYPQGEEAAAEARQKWPLFFDPQLPAPLRVEVGPGDLLFLPSMWHHYVQQRADPSGLVVAVNYWYDMKYDMKYAYFRFAEELAASMGLIALQDAQQQPRGDGSDSTEEGQPL